MGKVAEFMKNKSDGAKSVIDKMNSATDSGLVEHVISTWVQYYKDLKKAEEMEAILNGAQGKFGAFSERNKAGAMSAGQKAQAVKEYGLYIHSFLLWTEFSGLSVCCDITRCVWSQRNISFRACRTCSEPSPHSSSKVSRMGRREIRLRSRTAARR